jgi:hypothetical protein
MGKVKRKLGQRLAQAVELRGGPPDLLSDREIVDKLHPRPPRMEEKLEIAPELRHPPPEPPPPPPAYYRPEAPPPPRPKAAPPPVQLTAQPAQLSLMDWMTKKKNPTSSAAARKVRPAVMQALRVLRRDDPRAFVETTRYHGPVLAALLIDNDAGRTAEARVLLDDLRVAVRAVRQ